MIYKPKEHLPIHEITEDQTLSKAEFQSMKESITENEAEAWKKSQELRKRFEESYEDLFDKLEIKDIEQAKEKSFEVIQKVLKALEGHIDLSQVDPGHGLGHLSRDYMHAVVLADKAEIDPKQAYVGIVGGVFHDFLGVSLIDRYSESNRAIRHAEAGGLLFEELAKKIGIDEDEALLIYYSIAAHTNYLRPTEVECADGETREITPYLDTDKEDNPIMSVTLARWADRLDVIGPNHVGRHFLTLAEEHEDYGEGQYYQVKFADHMRPLLRSEEEIKKDPQGRTMREHLNMYARSQANDSPYGKHDYGEMVRIRDNYKEMSLRIIDAFDKPIQLSEDEENILLDKWSEWLTNNIEPSQSAEVAAKKLRGMFEKLPKETKEAWYSAMKVTFDEYGKWSDEMIEAIAYLPQESLTLPIIGDVRDIIHPNSQTE